MTVPLDCVSADYSFCVFHMILHRQATHIERNCSSNSRTNTSGGNNNNNNNNTTALVKRYTPKSLSAFKTMKDILQKQRTIHVPRNLYDITKMLIQIDMFLKQT